MPRRQVSSIGRLVGGLLTVALIVSSCARDADDASSTTTTSTTEAPAPPSTTEAPIEAGEVLFVYVPTAGDCFDRRFVDPEQGGERIILRLPCELPHTFEVFAVFAADPAAIAARPPLPGQITTLPAPVGTDAEPDGDGDTETTDAGETAPDGDILRWPGEELLEREARLVCPTFFEEWVGLAYELSDLEIGWIVPTEEAWESGERTVGCTVYDRFSERLTDSQAGTRR